MNGAKHIAKFVSLLVLTLLFAVYCGSAVASEKAGSDSAAADHSVTSDAGHGASKVSKSLSAAKVKDLGWRVVNFIALMIILVKFGAKPIGAGLAGRQKKIKDEIEDLQQKRADAEKSYNDFQAKLASVESEIDKIVDRAVAQAEIEKVKIIEKAEQAAHDIQRSAEMAIQNELTEARRTLKNEVAEQAAIMAEKLIVNNLTADDQVKIIDNYLAKVGAVQ